jgi:hypothetical protein
MSDCHQRQAVTSSGAAMNSHSGGSRGERLGYRLGHATRRLVRRATAVRETMVRRGLHPLVATLLVRAVPVAFAAILICIVLLLGLLIALTIVLARLIENADLRGHCCSCQHCCHCQCVWCDPMFWEDDTWK